ncbi:hypothetical protein SNEBB_004592 [Seison nebaliae]|nr:hypothetical protein SNEBB_004592 [Seison nebaliae]
MSSFSRKRKYSSIKSISNNLNKKNGLSITDSNFNSGKSTINGLFDDLRKCIPTFPYEKRLSKIDTLHIAYSYISLLKSMMEESNEGNPIIFIQKSASSDPSTLFHADWASNDLLSRICWLNWSSLGLSSGDANYYSTQFNNYLSHFKRNMK